MAFKINALMIKSSSYMKNLEMWAIGELECTLVLVVTVMLLSSFADANYARASNR